MDRPFLDKIAKGSTYCSGHEEYVSSIVGEIENVLSCRLKDKDNGPFSYGVSDILSIGRQSDGLEKFGLECQEIIKKLEPRISDIEITSIVPNNNNQTLELTMTCILKKTGQKIYPKVIIS
jgi:predicted component of type VI protein secretion system